nr:MAG TPA: hypothetical protein [Caudoviricetes sp.]
MRFSSTHQPKPSRRRGGRPKSPATIERERAEAVAAEKREADRQAAAFAAFEAAESGDFNGFEFADAFHRAYNKADAIYTAEANDSAEAVTPWGVIPTGADGVTVYVMNDAPRKTVYFNRSIYLI